MSKFLNMNCMDLLPKIPDGGADLTLTDIPYNAVNRESNGLIKLDREDADVLTFNLHNFIKELYRVTKSTIIIFCGKEQLSEVYDYFNEKQKDNKGTVRQLIYEKTNPVPSNGQYIYLSGIENAVWFKKRGGTFNAKCKNTVFRYPIWGGKDRIHLTEKHHGLLKELILDNSNEGDLVFDPCAGSGSTLLVAKQLNRRYLGCELNTEYYNKANERLLKV